MIGLFYISSIAFMFSCIILFEYFSWTSFFCYLLGSSLLVMFSVLADIFKQWLMLREFERWIREGEEDDDE